MHESLKRIEKKAPYGVLYYQRLTVIGVIYSADSSSEYL